MQKRIPASNQDIPFEVRITGREDHLNGKKDDYDALGKIP